ncbi:uncharacterized protein BDV14DRAFT_207472 [Aspergillus stella-maris]|uniref:uncharacterized protein n=1 Tax=Aspergillus stella-maris TaxID=1810926 RepID=UPI003CCDBE54
MAASAETLFDYLGERYEDAFSSSPYLISTIRTAIDQLPPKSHILDIGSGTGNPTSAMLAGAGHKVHGIDVSNEMVKVASRKIPSGTFQKADMRTFTPPNGQKFDAVFAILSLFQITAGNTYSVCFRFGEWVKPGGIVIVGVSPSNSLDPGIGTYDLTWDCVRYLGKPWMDQYTNETFFSEDAWRRMLGDAGFRVEAETFYDFVPEDAKHQTPERHHFFIARRTGGQNPLLGPYCLPKADEKGIAPVARPAGIIPDRLTSADLEKLYSSLSRKGKVLYLGSRQTLSATYSSKFELNDGPFDTLPFPSETFTSVLVSWKLGTLTDYRKTLSETTRVTSRAPGSQICIIQGAPDNEDIKIFNSLNARQAPKVPHQGRLLKTAIECLADYGYGDVSLSRVKAWYDFPECGLEKRSDAATDLMMELYAVEDEPGEDIKTELRSKLRLHFEDGTTAVGNDMVLLTARAFPN